MDNYAMHQVNPAYPPMQPMNPMDMTMDMDDRMERMYPDVYTMLAPHVQEVADGLSAEALDGMTHADVARMADDALRRSGMLTHMPPGHNPDTLNDMARTMAVRHVIDRRRGFGLPFFPFFPFFPIVPFDGRHFRNFGRGFGPGFGPRHRI